jgi:hypothetical protein
VDELVLEDVRGHVDHDAEQDQQSPARQVDRGHRAEATGHGEEDQHCDRAHAEDAGQQVQRIVPAEIRA